MTSGIQANYPALDANFETEWQAINEEEGTNPHKRPFVETTVQQVSSKFLNFSSLDPEDFDETAQINSVIQKWDNSKYAELNETEWQAIKEEEGTNPHKSSKYFTFATRAPADFNGIAQINFDNGAVYRGSLKNGKPDGEGTMIDANGGVYKGEWKEGKRTGHGIAIAPNNFIYKGEMQDNRPHGNGLTIDTNNVIFKGQWNNGMGEGRGRSIDSEGYVQEWKSSLKDGRWVAITK